MNYYKKVMLHWIVGMVIMLLLAIHFREWLVWDNFLAGLMYSLGLVVVSMIGACVW